MASRQPFLVIAPEVEAARAAGGPVVALESTLIAHGLPYPQNVEAALGMEAEVRAAGATPATIGVLAGRIVVGLRPDEVERLATARGVAKVSRRDLPVVLARGATGATTVAGTLAIMALVGLRVFATGGIGGVHRDAAESFDLSADLAELARVGALVVCAGAKAVLDLRRTVEALETLGVTVLGYRTDQFPAFYSATSGLPVPARVETPAEAAAVLSARLRLGLDGAVLLTVPPPAAVALPAAEIEAALEGALAEAARRGVRGPALTPFLLQAVAAATGGRSLAANVALLRQNARTAAEAAVALSRAEGKPAGP